MTTYSISLDDVDLSLLPWQTHTYNNFLKKEYYHFQVMKEDIPEPTDVNYTCHICAIEVPTAYASEHAVSIKHRANARIASEAMQRTRANISSLPLQGTKASGHFCANCAAVVDEEHEKTKEHRVAAIHDNLLWELMQAYVGDDDDYNANNKRSEDQEKSRIDDDKNITKVDSNKRNSDAVVVGVIDNNKTIGNQVEIKGTKETPQNNGINDKILEKNNLAEEVIKDTAKTIPNGDNTNKPEHQTNHSVVTTSRWVKVPDAKDIVENGTTQNGPTNTVSNEQKTKYSKDHYAKELNKFIDANNSYEFKEVYDRIHIKINNELLNVYRDHFHSYHRMYIKNNKIECIVCNCAFGYSEAEMHKYDLNHMSIVAKLGSDSNYVREINESYSHCILCNQKIKNVNITTHTQSQHHVIRKTNNVRSLNNKIKTPNNNNYTKEENVGRTEKEIQNGNSSKDSEISYPYEQVLGELRCVVCDCNVPRDLRNREEHVKGSRHVNNMK